MKKHTKSQLEKAYDSFYFTYNDWKGHTAEEKKRAYPHKLELLEKKAAKVLEIVNNCNVYAQRAWFFDSCVNLIPEDLQSFKDLAATYVPKESPSNVISISKFKSMKDSGWCCEDCLKDDVVQFPENPNQDSNFFCVHCDSFVCLISSECF